MTGNWSTESGSMSINVYGTYNLIGTAITFSASGTAKNSSSQTNTFNMTASGTLGDNTGDGTCTIVFSTWGTQNFTWNVTKK
jgi:hypothetical protein